MSKSVSKTRTSRQQRAESDALAHEMARRIMRLSDDGLGRAIAALETTKAPQPTEFIDLLHLEADRRATPAPTCPSWCNWEHGGLTIADNDDNIIHETEAVEIGGRRAPVLAQFVDHGTARAPFIDMEGGTLTLAEAEAVAEHLVKLVQIARAEDARQATA